MKPTLLIMAAGMGSRYGGLKQIDGLGPSDEIMLEYAVYDAIQAGFGKVVFIIRRDFEEAFRTIIEERIGDRIEVAYVFQELDLLPEGFSIPEGREKPWGTGHAILCARDAVQEPFGVINADDFYGRSSYALLAQHLSQADVDSTDFCLIPFQIGNTLSDHGTVTRALCELNDDGLLTEVFEQDGLTASDEGVGYEADGRWHARKATEPCSMNMWGFTPRLFDILETSFVDFLKKHGTEMKSEYLIPTVVADMIDDHQATFKSYISDSNWLGVTYTADKPSVQKDLLALAENGSYPTPLWS